MCVSNDCLFDCNENNDVCTAKGRMRQKMHFPVCTTGLFK